MTVGFNSAFKGLNKPRMNKMTVVYWDCEPDSGG